MRLVRSVTIQLHSALPPGVNPNGRYHWSQVARAKKQLRANARTAVMAYARDVHFDRARITITFRVCRDQVMCRLFPAYRPADGDNLIAACKALFDGLVDGGIVPDDRAQYIEHAPPIFELVPRVHDEGLEVLIEELPEEVQP